MQHTAQLGESLESAAPPILNRVGIHPLRHTDRNGSFHQESVWPDYATLPPDIYTFKLVISAPTGDLRGRNIASRRHTLLHPGQSREARIAHRLIPEKYFP